MAIKDQAFISQVRVQVRALWQAMLALQGLQKQATALTYTISLEDGLGDNEGITKDQVIAALFTSTDAAAAIVVSGGHATNFAKML